jgi:hypothetical protein
VRYNIENDLAGKEVAIDIDQGPIWWNSISAENCLDLV